MTSFDEVVNPVDQMNMARRGEAIALLHAAAVDDYLRGGAMRRIRLNSTIAASAVYLSRDEITDTINMAREED